MLIDKYDVRERSPFEINERYRKESSFALYDGDTRMARFGYGWKECNPKKCKPLCGGPVFLFSASMNMADNYVWQTVMMVFNMLRVNAIEVAANKSHIQFGDHGVSCGMENFDDDFFQIKIQQGKYAYDESIDLIGFMTVMSLNPFQTVREFLRKELGIKNLIKYGDLKKRTRNAMKEWRTTLH